jgi:YegS/Rv2252/BmrU family lipid kinase
MGKSTSKQVCIIVNPVSGVKRNRQTEFRQLVASCLDSDRFSPEVHFTRFPGHGKLIAREALEAGAGFIVVAGGDGSINEVAEVIAGTEAVLAIIPAGSGNGLAHHLKIPFRKKDAIDLLNHGRILTIDTCAVNGKLFASIAGIGFDARVARQFAKSHRRGFMTYARIVLKEYLHYKPLRYHLELDGENIDVEAFFVSFANSSQFGYNTRIAPQASITDGLIDVCIVRKPPVKALPEIAMLMFRQEIDRSKYIEIYRASNIRVKRKKGRTVNIDGEPVRIGRKLHIEVRPASLKVIVPK